MLTLIPLQPGVAQIGKRDQESMQCVSQRFLCPHHGVADQLTSITKDAV